MTVLISTLESILTAERPDLKDKKTSLTASLVVDSKCILGECIIYDDQKNSVLWTDIYGKRFHELKLSGSKSNEAFEILTYSLPKQLCSFALLKGFNSVDSAYLCAWEDGFQLFDIANKRELSNMSIGENVNPRGLPTRLNDGRCDHTCQRFICGGFYGEISGNHMKVFRCEWSPNQSNVLCHYEVNCLEAPDLEVTNSICFSPDGNTMYFADSPKRKIFAYNYDPLIGQCTQKRLLWQTEVGVPDGSCVDSDGFIWNATWRSGYGPGLINRINPLTGEVSFTVHLPDNTSQSSCCCFGGENLDVLFISTAAVDRNNETNAGGVYAVKVPFVGLKEARFQVR